MAKPKKPFDDIQQVVVESYANGEFMGLQPAEVDDCGDGLLRFLLIELSKGEDCDSFETAIDRLETAIRQLRELSCAFERKHLMGAPA